ncbi:ferredoxin III, nif-specific [Ectothiorhodospira mobilis]|uniref:ferredoxin III, nif-specific n=1 Tax=Ectothiorhodospira mobilis TaxID=195064 RepID=UPI001905B981|nr:ferredoxin III, nif-specific [Ectothiorhodospira mobilis]
MEPITGVTRGGTPWTPAFVMALNEARCIGCGRCYKVCTRNCFELVERDAGDEDEDDLDEAGMVMRLADPMDCIGCGACARVCPKNCHEHAPAC